MLISFFSFHVCIIVFFPSKNSVLHIDLRYLHVPSNNHNSCSLSRFWLVLSSFGIGPTSAEYDYVLLSLRTFR